MKILVISLAGIGDTLLATPLVRELRANLLAVYGRQEAWEDSPPGWPQPFGTSGEQFRTDGRPTAQWSRLAAGHSDDLGTASTA